MALGSKEPAVLGLILLFAASAAAQVTVEVRHDHWKGAGAGVLAATDAALTFTESAEKRDHGWSLPWTDIQRLWISPRKLRVLTYQDSKWKLGADRELERDAAPDASFQPLYALLKDRLDERLVAALDDDPAEVLWQVGAKHRKRFGGPEGILKVGRERIVFDSPEKDASRAWRLSDIRGVSTNDPFDLTITTYEGTFNFQLKEQLNAQQYNALWRRLNATR